MLTRNEFENKQIVFVFLNFGEKVSFSNDNVVVRNAEGKIRHQSTCYRIFLLHIVGNLTITTGIINRARKFGFNIVLMTSSMRTYDVIGHRMEGNVLLRKLQYEYNDDSLARHIIWNKIHNQRSLLNKQRNKDSNTKEAIRRLDEYKESVRNHRGELTEILGIEGSASRLYFKNHFNNINWPGRKPRIKCDYINSVLDIGYTLVFNILESLLYNYGFDVYVGVLHKQFYMRKSLVCDLVEPFRPLIDSQIKRMINLKQCKEDDFININQRWQLKWENNYKYTAPLVKPLIESKNQLFIYVQEYYRAFMKQKPIAEYPIWELGEHYDNN